LNNKENKMHKPGEPLCKYDDRAIPVFGIILYQDQLSPTHNLEVVYRVAWTDGTRGLYTGREIKSYKNNLEYQNSDRDS